MAQLTVNFYSYTLRQPIDVALTLPSLSSCDRDLTSHAVPAPFPVLYLLHGGGNDYRCWLRYTSAERYAEEHRLALVTCSVGSSAYENREWGRYYDLIATELPDFLCSYFPISRRPEDTYLCGYSMGGYGTIIHSLLEPEKYAAVGYFSPGIFDPDDQTEQPVPLRRFVSHDAFALAEAADPARLPKIFMCVGERDFLAAPVRKYHAHLAALGIDHRYDELPGYEHEFAIWDLELERFMDWLPRTDPWADQIPHKI